MNAPTGGQGTGPALADFVLLNEEIAALVRARVPLESHLAQIGAELPGKAGELARRIGARLEAGDSLVDAIEAECATMPAAYRATVVAGLKSGDLAGALESIVDTASRVDQLRRITGVALLYPMMVIAVMVGLLSLIIAKVLPAFPLVSNVHDGPVAWLVNWRDTVMKTVVIATLILFLVTGAWWWFSGRARRPLSSRLGPAAWLPGARSVIRWSETATFADLLLLMVERGVSLDHALRLASETVDDAGLRSRARELAEHIERGDNITRKSTINEMGPRRSDFPLLIRLALFHSATREQLVNSLKQAAVMYRDRASRAAEWYAEYVPILLTVAIGGTLTICFTLLVLWPYTSMLHELAGINWK